MAANPLGAHQAGIIHLAIHAKITSQRTEALDLAERCFGSTVRARVHEEEINGRNAETYAGCHLVSDISTPAGKTHHECHAIALLWWYAHPTVASKREMAYSHQ